MKWGRYQILTKRHVLGIMALVFLAGVVVVLLAALIPYAYTNAMAVANKKIPVSCTDRSNRVVSFTFETMQGNENTDELLKALADCNVTATFFVTGEWVDLYPESVKAIYDAGHEIMNCSDEYVHIPTLTKSNMIKQINACNDKIQAITGVRPTLFRAPYGDYDNTLMETLESLNMVGIQWDVDSMDAKGLDADAISYRVTSLVCSGSIVRFQSQSEYTAASLPSIVEDLRTKGYQFLTVSNMIYADNYTLNNDGRQIALSK